MNNKWIVVALGLLLSVSVFAASDKDGKENIKLPMCGELEDIIKVVRENDKGVIVKLESGSGDWQVETVSRDGKRRKYSINCTQYAPAKKDKAAVDADVPPENSISIIELTKLVRDKYKGEVKNIRFVSGKWVVNTIEAKIQTTRIFSADGKLLSTSSTD